MQQAGLLLFSTSKLKAWDHKLGNGIMNREVEIVMLEKYALRETAFIFLMESDILICFQN